MKKLKTVLIIVSLILAIIIGIKLCSHPKPMGSEPQPELYSMTEQEFWKPKKEYKGELYASDDLEMYPFYASLTDKEQQIYDTILEGIEKYAQYIDLPFAINEETLNKIIYFIGSEQEQLFWYDGNVSAYGEDDAYVLIEPCYNELVNDIEGTQEKIQLEVDKILNEAKHMSPLEAEQYVYQYICKNTAYKNGAHDQDIYSVFVQHESVCAGMCNAFRYVLRQLGIPCYLCFGTGTDSVTGETDAHSWNIIKLGDGYYNVDITYDDQYGWDDATIDYVQYKYFNLTDEEIAATHVRDDLSLTLPACNSEEYSFEQIYGCDWETACLFQIQPTIPKIVTSLEDYHDACCSIFLQYGLGEHTFTFISDSKETLEEIERNKMYANADKNDFLLSVFKYYNYDAKDFQLNSQLKVNYSGIYYYTQTISLDKKE